jgi:hypothetical protein
MKDSLLAYVSKTIPALAADCITFIKLVKQISLYTFLKKHKDVNTIIMEVKMINALLIHYQMLDKIASYT